MGFEPTVTFDGVLISGQLESIPGLKCASARTRPELALKLGEDGHRAPGRKIDLIVLHGTMGGSPQTVLDGAAPAGNLAERNAYYWRHSPHQAATHLVVDQDGTVLCTADLADVVAYGAGKTNARSIQIEMAQSAGNTLYREQLRATALLVQWLCKRFGVPLKMCWPYRGWPIPSLVAGGSGWRGVIQHRDCSGLRGKGDAGDAIGAELQALGFVAEDLSEAASRERELFAANPPPSWLLPEDEIKATLELRSGPELAAELASQITAMGLGLGPAQTLELVAHAVTESAWLQRDVGHNLWGWKARRQWADQERSRGRRAWWWRRAGHKGEAPVVYYRGFGSLKESVLEFIARFCPKPPEKGFTVSKDPATGDYRSAGHLFWTKRESEWFPSILAAGYRGDGTKTHPLESIREHKSLVQDAAECWLQAQLGVRVDGSWGPMSKAALKAAIGTEDASVEACEMMAKRVRSA